MGSARIALRGACMTPLLFATACSSIAFNPRSLSENDRIAVWCTDVKGEVKVALLGNLFGARQREIDQMHSSMDSTDYRSITANVFAATATKALEQEFVVIRPEDVGYEHGRESPQHDVITAAARTLGCDALVELVVSPTCSIGYRYEQGITGMASYAGDRYWATVDLGVTMTRLRDAKSIWRTSACVHAPHFDRDLLTSAVNEVLIELALQ